MSGKVKTAWRKEDEEKKEVSYLPHIYGLVYINLSIFKHKFNFNLKLNLKRIYSNLHVILNTFSS